MLKTDETRKTEHEAVRNDVGFYDFTHELIEASGPDAAEFLDTIFVNSVAGTENGGSVYTTMLDEDGKIIDDLIVFRLGSERFWVSTLEADFMLDWLNKHHDGEDVEFKDIRDESAMYAIQGPKSRDLMNRVLDRPVDDLAWFHIEANTVDGWTVWVARAGFTGELGYEIYLDANYTGELDKILLEEGESLGVRELETDVVLKSLPVEKGYVLMSDVGELTPSEAQFGWSVDWDTNFIGKEALEKEKDNPSSKRLLGYKVTSSGDDVEIEEGSPIFYNDEEVGKVTSFTYGYTVDNYIGYVIIDTDKVEKGENFNIESGGNTYEAVLQDRIFYDEDNERLKI